MRGRRREQGSRGGNEKLRRRRDMIDKREEKSKRSMKDKRQTGNKMSEKFS